MSFIKNALRTGVMLKVAQVAKRELSKPENQRKIREAVTKAASSLRKTK